MVRYAEKEEKQTQRHTEMEKETKEEKGRETVYNLHDVKKKVATSAPHLAVGSSRVDKCWSETL